MMEPDTPIKPRSTVAIFRLALPAIPFLLLIWRLSMYPLTNLWRDWVAILSVYWYYILIAPRARASPILRVSIMAYLLMIYSRGQLPWILAILGIAK